MGKIAKVIKGDKVEEKDFGTVRTKTLLDTPEVPEFSVNWVYKQKSPEGRMSKSEHCDTAYYVISGSGHALINNEEIAVTKGDVVYIPKGEEYELSEGIETIAVCSPRFSGNAA